MTMIRLDHNNVQNISLSASNEGKGESESSFEYETIFSDEDLKNFAIMFYLKMNTSDFNLEVAYSSFFEADDDITNEDQDSKFYRVNAPAIAYPFLRAYISNLLLSSGLPVVMIPTINFVKLAAEKKKQLEQDEKNKLLE